MLEKEKGKGLKSFLESINYSIRYLFHPFNKINKLHEEIEEKHGKLHSLYSEVVNTFKNEVNHSVETLKKQKTKLTLMKTKSKEREVEAMIEALELRKRELNRVLEEVIERQKRFLAQQQHLKRFEEECEKHLKRLDQRGDILAEKEKE